MTSSALVSGTAGILLTFFPQETLSSISGDAAPVHHLLLQIIGALYFAFGMLNWAAKDNLIGGIYGRPIAIGNLTHFVVGALVLLKGVSSHHYSSVIVIAAVMYSVFAILFGIIFYQHPVIEQQ